MTLQFVSSSAAVTDWGDIATVLAPALARSSITESEILAGIVEGRHALFRATDDADGYVVATTGFPAGCNFLALWVLLAAGQVRGGVRHRLTVMRQMLKETEQLARAQACRQVRVEGRPAWRRVLQGYRQHTDGSGNRVFVKVI